MAHNHITCSISGQFELILATKMVLERSTHLTHKIIPTILCDVIDHAPKISMFFFNAYVLLDETHVILLSQSCTENEV